MQLLSESYLQWHEWRTVSCLSSGGGSGDLPSFMVGSASLIPLDSKCYCCQMMWLILPQIVAATSKTNTVAVTMIFFSANIFFWLKDKFHGISQLFFQAKSSGTLGFGFCGLFCIAECGIVSYSEALMLILHSFRWTTNIFKRLLATYWDTFDVFNHIITNNKCHLR